MTRYTLVCAIMKKETKEPDFTETLWASVEHTHFAAILQHPFILGLSAGTLPISSFRHYVVQDALYLRQFGRALALLAAKADTSDGLMLFCEHARNTVIVERALHEGFMKEWDLRTETDVSEEAPNCLLYTAWQQQVIRDGSYADALAAVLPCYWIYWEVGKALVAKGSPNPLYQRWIDTYAGEAFAECVRAVLAEMNRVAGSLTIEQKSAAREIFVKGCRFEYMFWDMGWKLQNWD